jgi:hypothetical protein
VKSPIAIIDPIPKIEPIVEQPIEEAKIVEEVKQQSN